MLVSNWKKCRVLALFLAALLGVNFWSLLEREDPGLGRPLVWSSLALEDDCMFCVTSLQSWTTQKYTLY